MTKVIYRGNVIASFSTRLEAETEFFDIEEDVETFIEDYCDICGITKVEVGQTICDICYQDINTAILT